MSGGPRGTGRMMYVTGTTGVRYSADVGTAATHGTVASTSAANVLSSVTGYQAHLLTIHAISTGDAVITLGCDDGANGQTAVLGTYTILSTQACPFQILIGGPNGRFIPGSPAIKSSTTTVSYSLEFEPVP